MTGLCRNGRGLSQVVTTLILLVVAVLLTGVVTYYATNVTMTRTQQEEVRVTWQHIWVNGTGGTSRRRGPPSTITGCRRTRACRGS